MKSEHLIIAMGFAVAAVVVILYQHANATAQITSALGATGNVGPVAAAVNYGSSLGVSASLAGTPTVGQEGSSVSPGVVPLQIQPGYGFS